MTNAFESSSFLISVISGHLHPDFATTAKMATLMG